jgi:hypothetical protein
MSNFEVMESVFFQANSVFLGGGVTGVSAHFVGALL